MRIKCAINDVAFLYLGFSFFFGVLCIPFHKCNFRCFVSEALHPEDSQVSAEYRVDNQLNRGGWKKKKKTERITRV